MNLSHEEIAARTGKDRTTITNMVRLLQLPKAVQLLVAERRLSMGHARAILGLATPELQTADGRESCGARILGPAGRATGQESESSRREPVGRRRCRTRTSKPRLRNWKRRLGTRVRIVEKSDQRGRIEIEYYSQAELERLFEQIVSTGSKD